MLFTPTCVTDSELKKEKEKEDPTRRANRGGTAGESRPHWNLRGKKIPGNPSTEVSGAASHCFPDGFSQNKSDHSKISTKCTCDLQVFPSRLHKKSVCFVFSCSFAVKNGCSQWLFQCFQDQFCNARFRFCAALGAMEAQLLLSETFVNIHRVNRKASHCRQATVAPVHRVSRTRALDGTADPRGAPLFGPGANLSL